MAKHTPNVDETTSLLCQRIEKLLAAQAESNPSARLLVAMAGVPGSGKSTISSALLEALPRRGIQNVTVLPMDGFHYTKDALSSFEDPTTAFRRRGAPFTFDSRKFLNLLLKLKELPVTSKDEPEVTILAPSFDHAEKDPVEDTIKVSSRSPLVIVEGNYTLLDEDPWNQIADLADDRWFVDATNEVAQDRLVERHLKAGIETSREAALARALDNDIPNGDLIRARLIEPTLRILN